jgi:hypothetical protein
VQARIDLVYQEHRAKLGKRRHDPARKTIDYFRRGFLCGSHALDETNSATRRSVGGFAANALEYRFDAPLPD